MANLLTIAHIPISNSQNGAKRKGHATGLTNTNILGKSDADYTRECMKSKGDWTYGLVVGISRTALQSAKSNSAQLPGQHVTITGEVTGNTIAFLTIKAAK